MPDCLTAFLETVIMSLHLLKKKETKDLSIVLRFCVCSARLAALNTCTRRNLHARNELVRLLLKGGILLLLVLDVALVGLGVVGPALLLEKVLHLWNVVGHQDLPLLLGSAILQTHRQTRATRRERSKTKMNKEKSERLDWKETNSCPLSRERERDWQLRHPFHDSPFRGRPSSLPASCS
mmetsp:Transcript_5130/g.12401  ORF Transcript_5130/g.12401 Transcript_5130/m.12401 type:complete len:180 (+) Transcript_5130:1051-1590(+)